MYYNPRQKLKFYKPFKLSYNERAIVHLIRYYPNDRIISNSSINLTKNRSETTLLNSNIQTDDRDVYNINDPDSLKESTEVPNHIITTGSAKKRIVKSYRFHGREREYSVRLRMLQRVCEILNQLLASSEAHIDGSSLNEIEIEIVLAVLKRKIGNQIQSDILKSVKKIEECETLNSVLTLNLNAEFIDNNTLKKNSQLESIIQLIKFSKPSKRVEENNKFVYKHTNAYLYSKFVTTNKLTFSKESENFFYEHYFAEYAAKIALSIDNFCDPVRICAKSRKEIKSLNTEYLLRILGCEKYRIDFFEYVQTEFVSDYLSAICKKIARLLMPLENRLRAAKTYNQKEVALQFIKAKIESKWCKIPWSYEEVNMATSHFILYFNKLLYIIKFIDIKVAVKLILHPNIFENHYNELIKRELGQNTGISDKSNFGCENDGNLLDKQFQVYLTS